MSKGFSLSLFAVLCAANALAKVCSDSVGDLVDTPYAVEVGVENQLRRFLPPFEDARDGWISLRRIEARHRSDPNEVLQFAGPVGRDALSWMLFEDRTLSERERLETLEGLRTFFLFGGAVVVDPKMNGDGQFEQPTSTSPPRIRVPAPLSLLADGATTLHHEVRHWNDYLRLLRRHRTANPALSPEEAMDRLTHVSPAIARFFEDRALRNGPLATPQLAGYGIEMQILALGRGGALNDLQPGSDAHRTLARLLESHASVAPKEHTPLDRDWSPLRRELHRPRSNELPEKFLQRASAVAERTDRADARWVAAVETVWREVLPGLRRRQRLAEAAEARALGLNAVPPSAPRLLRDTARYWLARGAAGRDARGLAEVTDDVVQVLDVRSAAPENLVRILENYDRKPWAEYRRTIEALFETEDARLTAAERAMLMPSLVAIGMDRCPDFGSLRLAEPWERLGFHLAVREGMMRSDLISNPGYAEQLARVRHAAETVTLLGRLHGATGLDGQWARSLATLRGR